MVQLAISELNNVKDKKTLANSVLESLSTFLTGGCTTSAWDGELTVPRGRTFLLKTARAQVRDSV